MIPISASISLLFAVYIFLMVEEFAYGVNPAFRLQTLSLWLSLQSEGAAEEDKLRFDDRTMEREKSSSWCSKCNGR